MDWVKNTEQQLHKFLRNQGGSGRFSRVSRRQGGRTVVHRHLRLHQKTRRNTFLVTDAGELTALAGESESQHYNSSSSSVCFRRKISRQFFLSRYSLVSWNFSTLCPANQPGMSSVSAQVNLGHICNPSLHNFGENAVSAGQDAMIQTWVDVTWLFPPFLLLPVILREVGE